MNVLLKGSFDPLTKIVILSYLLLGTHNFTDFNVDVHFYGQHKQKSRFYLNLQRDISNLQKKN